MKKLAFISILLTTLSLFSCNSTNKSEEVASYTYEEKKVEMSNELKTILPDWVEEGKVCYGTVTQINSDNIAVKGKPVKAKVVSIGENSVKMKALETVSLGRVQDCVKMRLTKGEIWDEKDGDLYLTIEDAIASLKKKNLIVNGDEVTID